MDETPDVSTDLAAMVVPPVGRLGATADEWGPYRLLDPDGLVVEAVSAFPRDAGSGPILNPFPLDRSRRDRRAHTHHNPMEPHRNQRVGLYRPSVPTRIPRSIPDADFNELFARLPSHRDRALVAFYVSTG